MIEVGTGIILHEGKDFLLLRIAGRLRHETIPQNLIETLKLQYKEVQEARWFVCISAHAMRLAFDYKEVIEKLHQEKYLYT